MWRDSLFASFAQLLALACRAQWRAMPALGVIGVVAGARVLAVIAPVSSIDAARIAWRHRVPFEMLEIGLRRIVLVKSESPVGGARCH